MNNLADAYLDTGDCDKAIAVFLDLGLDFEVERLERLLARAREQCQ